MRLSLALVLAVAVAVAAFAVARADDDPAAATGAVTLVGDSLNVGIEPFLGEALSGWAIDAHDRVGRTTREGVERLRELGDSLAPVVVVSLGTNDPEGSEDEFRRLVDEAIGIVGPDRCLLWATIVRDGGGRAPFDMVLDDARAVNANVRLVEWASMVAEDETLLAGDGVHGTPEGYRRRGEQTARAVRACPRTAG